jgi:hypothetical protein
LDFDEVTLDNYRYLVVRHIRPRFGANSLGDIVASDVSQWSTDLHAAGYEHSTVEGIVGLLSRILADAVEDGLLRANPVHRHQRRGRRAFRIPTKYSGQRQRKSSAAHSKPSNCATGPARSSSSRPPGRVPLG